MSLPALPFAKRRATPWAIKCARGVQPSGVAGSKAFQLMQGDAELHESLSSFWRAAKSSHCDSLAKLSQGRLSALF